MRLEFEIFFEKVGSFISTARSRLCQQIGTEQWSFFRQHGQGRGALIVEPRTVATPVELGKAHAENGGSCSFVRNTRVRVTIVHQRRLQAGVVQKPDRPGPVSLSG